MSQKRTGLQKSIASVFKGTTLPEEARVPTSSSSPPPPAAAPGPAAPPAETPCSQLTPESNPEPEAVRTPPAPLPVYLAQPEPQRRRSWWSRLFGGR